MAQKTRIQLRRGVLADLPTLAEGEPGFTLDTFALYIGDGTNNHLINPRLDPNLLINGGFDFFQRQNPAAWTSIFERVSGSYPSARKFGPDRWALQINETATDGIKAEARRYDYSASSDNPGPKLCALRRSAPGRLAAYQILEAVNSIPLTAHTVTFQVSLSALTNSQPARIGLAKWSGAPDAPSVKPIAAAEAWNINPVLSPSFSWIANSGNITVPTAGYTTVTLSADLTQHTDLTNLLLFVYNSANTIAANDVLLIKEAGLYIGSQPQPHAWLPRPIAAELALCQRYYWKNYDVDAAPASSSAPVCLVFATSIAASGYYAAVSFPVNMRALPSVQIWSRNGVANRATNNAGTDYGANSAVPYVPASTTIRVFIYNNSGSAMSIGSNYLSFGLAADAEL